MNSPAYILIDSIVSGLANAWNYFVFVLLNGGWVVFAVFLLWAWFMRNWIAKVIKNSQELEWVYLHIVPPDEPSESIMAAEFVFNHLHASIREPQWRERWINGKFAPWYSFEIVSLGGVVRFIVRTPRSLVETVKSAFFSQYPDSDIVEVGDYMDAFSTPYEEENSDYGLWGTALEFVKHEAYPIKTYPMFEHRSAEVLHDPLSTILEVLSNIEADELISIQILAQPSNDDWKKGANAEADKLKRAEGKDMGGDEEHRPPTMLQHLSQQEKDVIEAVQAKLTKQSYHVKIKFMYAAPKDKMKLDSRLPAIFGGFTQFSAYNLNGFKPNMYSMTDGSLWMTREFLQNFKNRALHSGGKKYHLSTEELASLFHFPLLVFKRTSVERTESRRAEPPVNLPT